MLSFGGKLGQNIESVKFDMTAMLSTHKQRKYESYMYTNKHSNALIFFINFIFICIKIQSISLLFCYSTFPISYQ